NKEFLYFEDQNGKKAVAVGNRLTVESSGPVCAEIKLESPYFREKEPVARQITRLQFYEGQSYARVIHTFIFTKKTEEVWYKDIGMELKSPGQNFKAMTWSPEEAYTDKIESILLPAGKRLYLAQVHPGFASGKNRGED
ncbi:MAG: hypothetical protein NTY64_14370, partial [Deltaproteobacteria bacterium]|nr:hypothetical protein [Deltaproteobacteria bacterium]